MQIDFSLIQEKWSSIRVVVGLGNPGEKFKTTRHNVGFLFVDFLATHFSKKFNSTTNFEWLSLHDKQLVLVKPLTFMNSSGSILNALQKIIKFKPEEMLVVHDELEKKFGSVSLKLGGSSKGHNGVKSIIDGCGENFFRLRFGIGRPENREDVPFYVLENFSIEELSTLQCLFQSFLERLQL